MPDDGFWQPTPFNDRVVVNHGLDRAIARLHLGYHVSADAASNPQAGR